MGRRPPKAPGKGAEAFDVVHARVLSYFPELVHDLGGDADSLLRQAGIAPNEFRGRSFEPTYRQMIDALEVAAQKLNRPDFGMVLALRQRGGYMFGPLGAVMKTSRTFGDALRYVSQHMYAHSLAARVWLKHERGERSLFVGHDILLKRAPEKCQAIEQILLLGHLAAVDLTGGVARARRVHFRHEPVSPPRIYSRHFGCEVRFGENEDGMLFSEQDLTAPVVAFDEGAYRSATSYIDERFTRHQPPLAALARSIIANLLGTNYCTNEQVAAELNLHPRTLHRRLSADGLTFQKLKDDVRRDMMLYYLRETNLDLTLISTRLGFAEQSVMTRRCNQWFSASPTRLRVQARGEALTL